MNDKLIIAKLKKEIDDLVFIAEGLTYDHQLETQSSLLTKAGNLKRVLRELKSELLALEQDKEAILNSFAEKMSNTKDIDPEIQSKLTPEFFNELLKSEQPVKEVQKIKSADYTDGTIVIEDINLKPLLISKNQFDTWYDFLNGQGEIAIDIASYITDATRQLRKFQLAQFRPETEREGLREKLMDILNKYSKTDLQWMANIHGQNCNVIDFMDYEKIVDEYLSQRDSSITHNNK